MAGSSDGIAPFNWKLDQGNRRTIYELIGIAERRSKSEPQLKGLHLIVLSYLHSLQSDNLQNSEEYLQQAKENQGDLKGSIDVQLLIEAVTTRLESLKNPNAEPKEGPLENSQRDSDVCWIAKGWALLSYKKDAAAEAEAAFREAFKISNSREDATMNFYLAYGLAYSIGKQRRDKDFSGKIDSEEFYLWLTAKELLRDQVNPLFNIRYATAIAYTPTQFKLAFKLTSEVKNALNSVSESEEGSEYDEKCEILTLVIKVYRSLTKMVDWNWNKLNKHEVKHLLQLEEPTPKLAKEALANLVKETLDFAMKYRESQFYFQKGIYLLKQENKPDEAKGYFKRVNSFQAKKFLIQLDEDENLEEERKQNEIIRRYESLIEEFQPRKEQALQIKLEQGRFLIRCGRFDKGMKYLSDALDEYELDEAPSLKSISFRKFEEMRDSLKKKLSSDPKTLKANVSSDPKTLKANVSSDPKTLKANVSSDPKTLKAVGFRLFFRIRIATEDHYRNDGNPDDLKPLCSSTDAENAISDCNLEAWLSDEAQNSTEEKTEEKSFIREQMGHLYLKVGDFDNAVKMFKLLPESNKNRRAMICDALLSKLPKATLSKRCPKDELDILEECVKLGCKDCISYAVTLIQRIKEQHLNLQVDNFISDICKLSTSTHAFFIKRRLNAAFGNHKPYELQLGEHELMFGDCVSQLKKLMNKTNGGNNEHFRPNLFIKGVKQCQMACMTCIEPHSDVDGAINYKPSNHGNQNCRQDELIIELSDATQLWYRIRKIPDVSTPMQCRSGVNCRYLNSKSGCWDFCHGSTEERIWRFFGKEKIRVNFIKRLKRWQVQQRQPQQIQAQQRQAQQRQGFHLLSSEQLD